MISGAARFLPSHTRCALWALLFLVVLTYASTIIGPVGVNYVPMDPHAAWLRLLASSWVENGSDQRADWMGNLVTLIPFGFLVAAAAVPRRGTVVPVLGGVLALLLCLAAVAGIKYLQLFFPPRTVTLNYIVAQTAGVSLGILGFFWATSQAARIDARDWEPARLTLVPGLAIYGGLVCIFALSPFDFVLSADDWQLRLADLRAVLLSLPGEGRPLAVQLLLMLVGMAAYTPIGALLGLLAPRRDLAWITACGAAGTTVLLLVNVLVLSGEPHLVAIFYRTGGIVLGAYALQQIDRVDFNAVRRWLPMAAALLAPVYVVVVLGVNGLVGLEWLSPQAAIAQSDPRIFLPLFVFYIVSKATAAFSAAIHLVMYAPVGVLLWMRGGDTVARRWIAGLLAGGFSGLIEFGRLLRAGPTPDFNEIVVAAVAGYAAVRVMGAVWPALEAVARPTLHVRVAAARPAAKPAPEPEPAPPEPAVAEAYDGGLEEELAALPNRWQARAVHRATGQAQTRLRVGAAIARLRHGLVWPEDLMARGLPVMLAAWCLAPVFWAIAVYPVAPGTLTGALLVYAACLWRWPWVWLVVIPAVLPGLDLAPWTGWMFVSEADLFILTTVTVLLLCAPPRRGDLWLARGAGRISGRLPGAVLGLALLACGVGLMRGLSLPGIAAGSSNPYLMPENAWRLAKPLLSAVLLLPFLRARMRSHGDAISLAAYGMIAGLLVVTAAAVLERALFVGVFDFAVDYRVVASFSSMHVGGGHIGAFAAMAMPFLAVCGRRPRAWTIGLLMLAAVAAVYTLTVSFARMAYGAAALGMVVLVVFWLLAGRRTGRAWGLPIIVVLVIGGGLGGMALGTGYMAARLATTAPDLQFREANWHAGLAMRDPGLVDAAIGMGLGSYGRVAFARGGVEYAPSNFVLAQLDGRAAVVITARSPFYFGQKLQVPDDGKLLVTLSLWTQDASGGVQVLLCRKLLLYSEDCRGVPFQSHAAGVWQPMSAEIPTAGLRHAKFLGMFDAPIEVSLSASYGPAVAVAGIGLIDAQGRQVLQNGDFARGLDRWYFTDDDHWRWRIFNQYLMSFFEGGGLGLAALLALAGAAMAGGVRAVRQGDRLGTAVLASVVAFMCSCLVDSLLEAPRLATLFYLVCAMGLIMLTRPTGDVVDV